MNDFTIPTPKLEKTKINGVSRPRENSLGGFVWAVADAIQANRAEKELEHTVPLFSEVKDAVLSQLPNVKPQNISLYLGKWVKFNEQTNAVKVRKEAERKVSSTKRTITAENAVPRYKALSDRMFTASCKLSRASEALNRHVGAMNALGLDIPEYQAVERKPVVKPKAAKPAKSPKTTKAA